MMLDALLSPATIAVIGASRSPRKVGYEIIENLLQGGFRGTIVPVNPHAERIQGLTCFATPEQYGGPIDLAVIALPATQVLEATAAAVRAGAKSVIVVAAGFKEAGPAGADLEKRLASLCRSHKVRLLGPNCLGLLNTAHSLNLSFAGKMPEPGPVSMISQSGALCSAMLDIFADRHLGISKVINIGNKADISEVDSLHALALDPHTKVIIGYLEDISEGDDFIRAAEEASSEKPVVILKSGTTEAGLRAATFHTGILAGSEVAYGAAFKRSGVVRADSFESLFDFAAAFALQPMPRGKNVLVITNAGGPGIIAADAVEHAGLNLVTLAGSTTMALRDKLPEKATAGSPVYILGDADPSHYATALKTGLQNPEVDSVIVILTPGAMTMSAETVRAIAGNLDGRKPVLLALMGGASDLPDRRELVAAGLPDFASPERAVAALRAMWEHALWNKRPPRIVTRFRVNRRRVERIITRRLRSNSFHIGEVKAKNILLAYGFQVPEGYVTWDQDQAVETAERIGYPVAMKIVSRDIVSKTDLGGVRLNVTNPEEVRDYFDLMLLRIRQRAPNARIEGVYVEKMLNPGLEIIIGMNRDKQFGPMLMFGLGGIFVEAMKDVTFHLAPVTEEEALQMLKSTRSYEILKGKRGQHEIDLVAIANGLQRISQLATDFPRIAELDINPFIVGGPGNDAWVADARITLRKIAGS